MSAVGLWEGSPESVRERTERPGAVLRGAGVSPVGLLFFLSAHSSYSV